MSWFVYNSNGKLLQSLVVSDNAVTNAKMADDAIGVAELSASGTASSSTFLRGDNAWAAPAGGPSQANQAALEAETNEDTYAPPDLIKHSPGVAKCWVEWEMAGAHGITASHNYTSVSDGGGAGDSDHVFDTDFSSAGYAVAFGCEAHYYGTIGAKAAGTINPYVYNHAGTATDVTVSCLAAFGDQA